ncbi:protein disulfide-isomerase A2 [Pseudoliparis swirei]|uniref:protein disulfide-isomerase A2 n=1 Tax=Pseudoliparis swirei TaxID=2059687 RepID=UPI0024BD6051|nr:protein disulfide-isomerase A2 [Pseudoliparis swirei]
MRTHTLWTVALLGLLLWASCSQADDSHPEETQGDSSEETEDTEAAPKKEKTTEIEQENNVMVLHDKNFDRALSENQYLLVKFYVPWCGHCRSLEPIYAEVAGKLKEEGEATRLAQVEATEEEELSMEFEIKSYPTLKMFTNGDRKNPMDYTGPRTVPGMLQWIKRSTGPGAPVLDTAESAAQFIESHRITVIGFFDNLESEAVKAFKTLVLTLSDTEFALTTSPEVFQKYGVEANSVVLFKKFDEGRADFPLSEEGELKPKDLITFIKQNSLELIIKFSMETADNIFNSGIPLHGLLFINSSVESHAALVDQSRPIAKEFKGKMLMVVIDVAATVSNVLNFFGTSAKDAPTVRLINMDTGKKFAGDFTVAALRQLCQDVVDGVAKPYLKSEGIPEDWDKEAVKVLVGKNFASVALDPTKNVFVEFYAPWCKHCQDLSPIWEQLGEKYADSDDIIIAKMDSTANEVESVTIEGFPTLKYFPAGDKEVVDYSGQKDLETLSKFLDDGGVLPEAETLEDEDEFDDDDDEDVAESAEVATNTTSKDEL